MTPIQIAHDHNGVILTANGRAVDAWALDNAGRCNALASLRLYADNHPETVRFERDRITAPHAAIASLSTAQARALSLPKPPPYVFSTDTNGVIGNTNFKLITRWLHANRPLPTRRHGAFLETADGEFLIPEPLFSAIELAEGFKADGVSLPDHWTALATFRRLLDPSSSTPNIKMSGFLHNLRIYTAAALSLALTKDANGELDFDPVLFDAAAIANAEEEQQQLLSERDGLLEQPQLQSFQTDPNIGFRAFPAAKRSYLLGNNAYLIVDADLETALQVVREKQQAPLLERRVFAANPRAAIAARLLEAPTSTADPATLHAIEQAIEERTADLFLETPDYADRAIAIGIWEPPNLDGILPRTSNVWLPEIFDLDLGGVYVRVDRDTVVSLREQIDAAIASGESEIVYQGQPIPATPQVRQCLAEAIGIESPKTPPPLDADPPPTTPPPIVIKVEENFVHVNWVPQISPREVQIATEPPTTIRTALMPHQQHGLDWQIKAWQAGLPGVLNADEQGLGKTLQTLVFLVWLQQNMQHQAAEKRLPILIVAPTGLLHTWEREIETHLDNAGLGHLHKIYGQGLRCWRRQPTGKDLDDGKTHLDFDRLLRCVDSGNGHQQCLLTTYQTLTNYQHSFRTIAFSIVVFDEIQNIKNPKTLASLAARSVRAHFRIGLTGTPIENHVADLWAIMDAIAPGRLETLKNYAKRYRHATSESMRELHARVFKPTKSKNNRYPPLALRRIKDTEIKQLPHKKYRIYPTMMTNEQAAVYEQARLHLVDGARGSALKALHHIRGVSLHPQSPETVQTDPETYLARSARLKTVQSILTLIRDRNERVLLFIENRRMQAFVAQWLQSKFKLDRVALINGATSIIKRDQFVQRFQQHLHNDRGFDAMILSPKVAGVGLTLTAATHVIHLSRWWNPAVEEQCNDRIYRIGQHRNVTVHLPLAIHPTYQQHSFDCVLNDLMIRKRSLARGALWPPTDLDFDLGHLIAGLNNTEPIDLDEIDHFDWRRFEDWVMQRTCGGDWEVSQTPASGDGGADVILKHRYRSDTALVQVKYTIDRNRVMNADAVHEIVGAKERYTINNPQLVVISNARDFTPSTQQLALEKDVVLITRDRLGLWPQHVLG